MKRCMTLALALLMGAPFAVAQEPGLEAKRPVAFDYGGDLRLGQVVILPQFADDFIIAFHANHLELHLTIHQK